MTKNILITGGGKRIGKSIALHIAKNGWNVAIHCNKSTSEAENTANEISAIGQKATIIQADLANENDVKKIVKQASSELGVLSCLINNASAFANDTIENLSLESMRAQMEINYYAPMILSQEFVKQAEYGANIINMLDYCVLNLPDKFTSYAVSRSAMWTASQILAKQLAPKIRVNAIAIGHALMNDNETKENFERVVKNTPLEVATSESEVYNAVEFIINSSSMTGEIITLDSGKHLVGADYY